MGRGNLKKNPSSRRASGSASSAENGESVTQYCKNRAGPPINLSEAVASGSRLGQV